MVLKNKTIYQKLVILFLSFFGVGLIPIAPGTFGSLATIPLIYYFEHLNTPLSLIIPLIVILIIVSSYLAEYIEKQLKSHDPGWIVIDEVIGMLTTWYIVQPELNTTNILIIFITFRFFDIIKIFPANWCDKKINNGFGTIIDDVVSSLYAALVSKAIIYALI